MSRQVGAERGALAVEAALIVPILVILVFGVVEWGLAIRDQVEMSSVTRAGARAGSALAPKYNPYAPTVAANRLTAEVAYGVERAALGLPRNSIEWLYVYKANDAGFPGDATGLDEMASGCANDPTHCDRFKWKDGVGFANEDPITGLPLTTTPWMADTVNSCLDDADRIGVYLEVKRQLITGLFGSEKTIRSYTVMQFEPRAPGRCEP